MFGVNSSTLREKVTPRNEKKAGRKSARLCSVNVRGSSLPRTMQPLRRDGRAIAVLEQSTVVALAGARAAGERAVGERAHRKAGDRQAEERDFVVRRGDRAGAEVVTQRDLSGAAQTAGSKSDRRGTGAGEAQLRPTVLEARTHGDVGQVLRAEHRGGRGADLRVRVVVADRQDRRFPAQRVRLAARRRPRELRAA